MGPDGPVGRTDRLAWPDRPVGTGSAHPCPEPTSPTEPTALLGLESARTPRAQLGLVARTRTHGARSLAILV
jgi:hypothetical protein